ncbi:MAG TPA: hypothetical protein VFN96_01545 [Gemmatimonadales bacterium]|nr:hypothetical protein [Gemmatimonadales bacterium]
MRRWVAVIAAGIAPVPALAQSSDSAPIVTAIELRRHNIFSPQEAGGFLPRLANSLHATTRPGVIRRELLVRPGERYDSLAVAETARNLRSLGIFREVVIDTIRSDSGLVLRVTTADGWSTRPDIRFRSTGSSLVYTLSVEERNFLGTATLVGLGYQKTPDRSSVTTTFRQSRLFAGRVGLAAQYVDRSDGRVIYTGIAKPFFSLGTRSSWRLDLEERRERILRFYDGSDVARDTLQHRFALGYLAAAWALRASPAGYFRLGFSAQLRRDDHAVESRVDTLPHTVTGALGVFAQWRRARFLVSTGLEGFGRVEDVDVSTVIQAGAGLTPRAFGYEDDGIVPHLVARTGFGVPTRFVQLALSGSGRFRAAGLDSGSVHVSATAFLLPARGHLVALHAASGWQKNPAPGAEFDLGLGLGPRGFRQHAFTGDQAFFTTAEYRYTLAEDFLRLSAIGVAAFADYGGAWYRATGRRTGWDAGVGMRFGFTRSTDIESNRIDLVYRGENDAEPGGWVLVVAKGFAFSSSGRLDR